MKKYLRNKFLLGLISLSLLLTVTACSSTPKSIDPNSINKEELITQSIETMKGLESYTSNVYVKLTSENDPSIFTNINALIDLHKEPFSYSSVQEMQSTGTDDGMGTIYLSMVVKDDVLYTSNSMTGLWNNESEESLVSDVKENSDIFKHFSVDQFEGLEVVSTDEGKIKLTGTTNTSEFLKSLFSSFDTAVTGDVELTIDFDTKHLESLVYYINLNGESGEANKISIETSDFNNATEVVVPKDAL